MITIGKPRLTDAELAESYRSGTPVAAIAAAAGLTRSWTYRRLKRAGVDVQRPAARPSPVPAAQLAKEYTEGASIMHLVERHGGGLYYKHVRQMLLDEGVVLRPSTRSPESSGGPGGRG